MTFNQFMFHRTIGVTATSSVTFGDTFPSNGKA